MLVFVLVPLAELALLLYLAEIFSWQRTLLLVIVTGVLGTLLARSQGWRTWVRIRDELAAGRMPAESLLDAVLIFVAGALLLTPGVLTDALGISLLIPPVPRLLSPPAGELVQVAVYDPHRGDGSLEFAAPPLGGHRLACGRQGRAGGIVNLAEI